LGKLDAWLRAKGNRSQSGHDGRPSDGFLVIALRQGSINFAAIQAFPPMMTMPESFKIRVTKDHLVFSSGHFISYEGDKCERLHGTITGRPWRSKAIWTRTGMSSILLRSSG